MDFLIVSLQDIMSKSLACEMNANHQHTGTHQWFSIHREDGEELQTISLNLQRMKGGGNVLA